MGLLDGRNVGHASHGVAVNYLVYDDFIDADGTLLFNHNPDIDVVGTGWTEYYYFYPPYYGPYGNDVDIQSNQVVVAPGDLGMGWIDCGQAADVYLEMDITAPADAHDGGGSTISLYISSTDVHSQLGYRADILLLSGPGVFLQLNTYSDGAPLESVDDPFVWNAGDTHKLRWGITSAGVLTLWVDGMLRYTYNVVPPLLTGTLVGFNALPGSVLPFLFDNCRIVAT